MLKGLRHANIVGYVGVGAASGSPGEEEGGGEGERLDRSSFFGSVVFFTPAPPFPPHPGAVIPDDQCYIVQEYVSGGTLKRAVASAADRRPGDPPTYTHADAAAWGADVARGLAYLHGANPVILHRDLKLENVLLTARTAPRAGPDGTTPPLPPGRGQTAQLADFGLAVSFVSPDIDSRRSQLPPAEASGGAGSGGAGLGDRRASVVAEQMERADRGEKMTDRGVAAAASALETALSRWEEKKGAKAKPGASRPATSPPRPRPHRLAATNRHVYALTGKTGSYLYMAPCVTLCLPYNERADLFSLGCVLWELFSRRALATVVLGGAGASGATGADLARVARVAELYAHRVARGFRPPIPADWPPRVRALVAACWAGSPAERPTAAAVAAELEAMLGDGTLAEWDARAGEEEDEVRKRRGGGERQTAAPPRTHSFPSFSPPLFHTQGDWTGEGGCCVCF